MSTDGVSNLGYLKGEDSNNTVKGQTSGGDSGPSYPMGEVLSADILTKPFNIAAGSAKIPNAKFNPFRRKSGILNVLAKQAKKSRIVAKSGELRTLIKSKEDEGRFSFRLVKDIFISTINLSWSWNFVIFFAAFFGSWLIFAVVWYVIFWIHGDFDGSADRACVDNVFDFTGTFLFSVETQHTIGYGGRATSEQCEFAIFVMSMQSIIGVIINAAMAGIIFAKFTMPTARKETIIFSKNAAITMRNGALYLLCRVADLRENSLLEGHVRMIYIKDQEITEEGQVIPNYQAEIKCGVEIDGSNEMVMLFWPTVISHKIDEDSPLYEMGPQDLLHANFEILVTYEGSVEETGNTIQVRTSYLPNEIFWGYHFNNEVMTYDTKQRGYKIHTSTTKTNAMIINNTPRISAQQVDEKKREAITFKSAAHAVMACNRGLSNISNDNEISQITEHQIEVEMTT